MTWTPGSQGPENPTGWTPPVAPSNQEQWVPPSSMPQPSSTPQWAAPGATPASQWGEQLQWEKAPHLRDPYATNGAGGTANGAPNTNPAGPQQWAQPTWMPEQRPGIIPLRPLSLGELFEGTFRAVRTNPPVMFGFSLAVMAAVSLIGAIAQYFSVDSLWTTMTSDPAASIEDDLTATASTIATAMTGTLVTAVLVSAASAILSGMLSWTVSQAAIGRLASLQDTWAAIKPRIWPLIGTLVLTSLITLVTVLPFALPLTFLAVNPTPEEHEWGYFIILLLLAGLLYAVGLMIVTVKLLYAPTITVLEQLGPAASVARSWKLTRGAFWGTFGRYLLISLVMSTASSAVSFVVGIIAGILSVIATPAIGQAMSVGLSGVLSGFIIPLMASFITLMYLDQRMKTEGLAPALVEASRL